MKQPMTKGLRRLAFETEGTGNTSGKRVRERSTPRLHGNLIDGEQVEPALVNPFIGVEPRARVSDWEPARE
jgi:hypothetical protein